MAKRQQRRPFRRPDTGRAAAGDHFAEAQQRIQVALREQAAELDLSPLRGLSRLPPEIGELSFVESISLTFARVSDLAPLSGLTALQTLALDGTQVSDLAPLSGLTALQTLTINGTEVSDLAPLSRLTALQTLWLDETQVSDLAPLSRLTALQTLWLDETQVSDLAPLSGLTALQTLTLDGTQVSDLAPLSGLTALQSLTINGTQVSDLAQLSGLTTLQSLWLNGTQVSDLAPLSGLTALQTLRLDGTQVSDLAPLSGLTALQTLTLNETQVSDLAPLSELTALQDAAAREPITDGLSFAGAAIAMRAPFNRLVRLDQPARTVETINELRRRAGLPEHIPEGYRPQSERTIASFILDFLSDRQQPVTIDEVRSGFRNANFRVVDKSMRGELSRLAQIGEIIRLHRGRYVHPDWAGDLGEGDREEVPAVISVPPEPDKGPGPQYAVRGGRLSEEISTPTGEESDRQAGLHERLRADAARLAKSLKRSDRYVELAAAAQEYAELLDTPVYVCDVVGLWSVGGALASFTRSYRDQNVARTLAEPLEPQLEALLQNVVRQHGAFVMGFEEGRDLVNRADEFALDAARLREIAEPGNELLKELTDNRDLVEERTRALHRPVRDSAAEFGWATSRIGYSAYLIVRNGVRAMIKFSVGENPNLGTILGIMAGGSVLAGDPNAEFIRAAVPVLQQYGSQLLAFFGHSPEMRAYVEWALRVLESDQDDRNRA